MDTQNLNEAPASITFSVVTPKGYPALFTLRETSGIDLLKKVTAVEKEFEDRGYKPQIKTFGAKREVEYVKDASGNPMLCPMCKVGHVRIINSAKGIFYGCDTSKFDPATKTYTGCKFFSNTDPSKMTAPQANQENIVLPEDF